MTSTTTDSHLPSREYFGNIRRYGLVGGGITMGVGFEVSKAHIRPTVPLLAAEFPTTLIMD
jgi:hypothetical protein